MIVEGIIEPMELAHLPYRKGTYEDYAVGIRGLKRLGKKEVAGVRRRRHRGAQGRGAEPDEVVLGGGNVQEAEGDCPAGCRVVCSSWAVLGCGMKHRPVPSPLLQAAASRWPFPEQKGVLA